MNKMSISRKQGNFPKTKATKLSMFNAYQRRSNNVFDTAWTVFAACGVLDANWSGGIYKHKESAFFKYYLKILIRMAIMLHTRAKTELRHGRPNLLHSVINTAKQLGKCNHLSSWCGRKSKLDKQDRHVPCVLLDMAHFHFTHRV